MLRHGQTPSARDGLEFLQRRLEDERALEGQCQVIVADASLRTMVGHASFFYGESVAKEAEKMCNNHIAHSRIVRREVVLVRGLEAYEEFGRATKSSALDAACLTFHLPTSESQVFDIQSFCRMIERFADAITDDSSPLRLLTDVSK